MDLSGLIFVALAVAWAGYLIPRALRQHEDAVAAVPADTSTDDARVLVRTSAMMRSLLADHEPVAPERKEADRVALKASEAERRAALPRPAKGGPAVRRRRILLLLVVLTGAVAGAAGLGHAPWWSVTAPAALVVLWLVLCVQMSRHARQARAVRSVRPALAAVAGTPELVEDVETADPVVAELVAAVVDPAPVETLDTTAEDRLWDPLPLTLPTYVGKPVARRTARAIELGAITSSGHDAADSELAGSALARAVRAAGQGAAETPTLEPVRRAAGA